MAKKRIVVYTAEGCTPCEEVAKLVEQGRVSNPDIEKIELVDIGTDEGFARFTRDVLSKEDGGIPGAYLDDRKCRIEILEDDTIYFDCSNNDLPAGPEEISSPPGVGAKNNVSPPGPQASPPELQS